VVSDQPNTLAKLGSIDAIGPERGKCVFAFEIKVPDALNGSKVEQAVLPMDV
jgi:hypothetical protein